jgi:hypothetical protein
MLLEHGTDDLALHSHAAAVDDADLAEPALDGLIEVLFHHNPDLTWLKSVEVDGVFDRNVMHWIKYNHHL